MTTTLDPTKIIDIGPTGSLSNNNLTLSTTGYSVAPTTAIIPNGRITFEVRVDTDYAESGLPAFEINDSNNSSPTFSLGFAYGADGFGNNSWNIILNDGTGRNVALGNTSPAPSLSDVFTVDIDIPSKRISVRVNGNQALNNADISSYNSSIFFDFSHVYAAVSATSTSYNGFESTSSVKFRDLTYSPLPGYREWDASQIFGYLARNNSKRYFEVTVNDNLDASNTCIGIVDAANTDNFFVLSQSGNVYPSGSGPTFTSNNTITVAVDFDNSKIYFGKDATPNTSATGISITSNTSYVPVVLTNASGVDVTVNEGD